jgi:lipopolysaccharide assembly outer membrane protein LptD (OstA)
MILFLLLGFQQDTTQSEAVNVVHYSAQQITYDLERSLIILHDSATIMYQDITLLSDSAYYHVDKNLLEAFGTCDLRQVDDSIKGDYLVYNIETKKALMTSGKTQIESGFLEGERIYWIDEHTVNAYDGKYTTCSDSPPHYYFYSPKMKVYLGDMVIARPIVLYIEDVPIIAAPFWFVPISTKRKSGLLPFRAGNSSTYGKYIRGFSYYWVISDYVDVTLQVDAYEKKGIMPHLETVWDYAPFSKGVAHFSYIRETDTKIERYSIEARNNSDYFLLGSSFNCDVKYLSDNTYHQDYAETTALWLEKEITSQATISRDIFDVRNTVTIERREYFTDSLDSLILKLPYYTMTTPSQMLFSTVSYSISGHISRDRTTLPSDTNDVAGANLHTAPSLQQSVYNLFTVSPKLNLDAAVYDEDTLGNKMPTRFGYSFDVTASTNLYRVFRFELFGIHGILHKLLPKVTYSYTPDFDFGRFPSVAGIPTFAKTHAIGFGLDQEFETKVGEEEQKYRIARLSLSSGYNLITDSLAAVIFSLQLPFNPFPQPITTFSSQIDGSIDPYTREYTYTLTNTSALEVPFFSIRLNQSYSKGGVYQIWFNGSIKPTEHWSLTYSGRYDWESKELVDYSIGLNRDLHCWTAAFSFNQLGDVWRYDFKVYINEIPEVSIGKGLLGYFLE